jgi:hypothetical protein
MIEEEKPQVEKQGSGPGKKVIVLIIGIIIVIVGLGALLYQSNLVEDRFTLSSDFDKEHTSTGKSTYVNTDYLYPYNPTYNGSGQSIPHGDYESEKITKIKGVEDHGSYVEFSYKTEISEQARLLIDVNTGAVPGGVAMLPPMGGAPPMPYPFEPHQATDTVMYLDSKEWNYRTDVYSAEDLTEKRGYARSVFTHDLEKKDYDIWIGPIENITTADFIEAANVQGVETYHYTYRYTMKIPYPIFSNETMGLTAFLSWEETVDEYHEPTVGALLKIDSNITFTLEVYGQGPPQTVTLYSEESSFEISEEDADSLSSGLFMINTFPMILWIVIIIGAIITVFGIILISRSRKTGAE